MKTIVVTGGGSGGHVAPIRAIAPELSKTKNIIWIGSSHFEKSAADDLNIEFKKIYSGKMRRGLNIKNIMRNIVDAFRLEYGTWQSLFFLLRNRPEKVFSTGGFVSVPVVIAAWLLRIPIVIHEQTIGFGLANKIAAICADKILLAFPESQTYIPEKFHHKISVVGNPIRAELLCGNQKNLEKFLGINVDTKKPILYITGGGQGSALINSVVFELLAALEKDYYIIHQTGKTGIDAARIHADTYEHYFPYQFIGAELADIYACADVVLGRAGAGTVNELDYFNIYSVFVPLRPVQNDEQTKNAEWFLQGNDGAMISQAECNVETVVSALDHIQIDLRRDNTCEYTENNAAQLILENL